MMRPRNAPFNKGALEVQRDIPTESIELSIETLVEHKTALNRTLNRLLNQAY